MTSQNEEPKRSSTYHLLYICTGAGTFRDLHGNFLKDFFLFCNINYDFIVLVEVVYASLV